ncbi:hypothetical protein Bhyg_01835 [Pseudolycoriella hygida]|uniref:Uncharacterized protein n=1 Tax=Pseudolycoriella hygida TaxID=35572 RepID=A0A9Q0NA72_9DIPT|nr:hypothetical protein Bhyg_01835 [Pseudolycoriella hygida]
MCLLCLYSDFKTFSVRSSDCIVRNLKLFAIQIDLNSVNDEWRLKTSITTQNTKSEYNTKKKNNNQHTLFVVKYAQMNPYTLQSKLSYNHQPTIQNIFHIQHYQKHIHSADQKLVPKGRGQQTHLFLSEIMHNFAVQLLCIRLNLILRLSGDKVIHIWVRVAYVWKSGERINAFLKHWRIYFVWNPKNYTWKKHRKYGSTHGGFMIVITAFFSTFSNIP